MDQVRTDGIVATAFFLALGGVFLAGINFLAGDGPPWPVGVLGVLLFVPASAVLVARVREIFE